MRDFRLDNAKGLLIFLVVLGHIVERYTGLNEIMKYMRFEIYLFHMPLFIFISGYFSKKFIENEKFDLKKILPLIYIYIIMELFYVFYNILIVKKEGYTFTFFSESMIPWFMLALVIWKTATYLLKSIKPTLLLIASITLSIFIGLDNQVGDFMALSRVIVFYPFFLMGVMVKKEYLNKIINNKILFTFNASFFLIFSIIIYLKLEFFLKYNFLLSGRNSFKYLENEYEAILARIILIIITIIFSIFVMQLVGNKKNIMTWLGQRTISVYFFHEMLLTLMTYYGADKKMELYIGSNWIYFYLLLSIPITLILATSFFEKPLNYIMKNAGNKILSK